MKYRIRPNDIEARPYTYPATDELKEWIGDDFLITELPGFYGKKSGMEIRKNGEYDPIARPVREGNYIIKYSNGRITWCDERLFEATYEKIEE